MKNSKVKWMGVWTGAECCCTVQRDTEVAKNIHRFYDRISLHSLNRALKVLNDRRLECDGALTVIVYSDSTSVSWYPAHESHQLVILSGVTSDHI